MIPASGNSPRIAIMASTPFISGIWVIQRDIRWCLVLDRFSSIRCFGDRLMSA
jgi:hypothetical protein